MKRVYEKPQLSITEFVPDMAISVCYDEVSTEYKDQTIECIINGSETIFDSDCQKSVSNGQLVTYDGTTYYVWYNGTVSGRPTTEQQTKLDAILTLAGVKGQSGWHAGPATSTIITTHNHS